MGFSRLYSPLIQEYPGSADAAELQCFPSRAGIAKVQQRQTNIAFSGPFALWLLVNANSSCFTS